jgi:hypothetical protein
MYTSVSFQKEIYIFIFTTPCPPPNFVKVAPSVFITDHRRIDFKSASLKYLLILARVFNIFITATINSYPSRWGRSYFHERKK